MTAGAVVEALGEILVDLRVERAVGGVDNAGCGTGFALVVEEVAEVGRDGFVMTHGDFVKEGRANNIHVSRSADSTSQEVDRVGPIGFVVTPGVVSEVKFIPKISTGDPGVFKLSQGGFLSVNVVNGEKGGDTEFLSFGGDEAGHPVVTVDDVRLNPRDDVVNEISLKGEGRHEKILLASLVDATAAIKFAVFGEVDAIAHRDAATYSGVCRFFAMLEEIAVVRDGEVNVFVGCAESVDEQCGDIGKSSRFCPEAFRIFGELFGDVGDFRSDEKNARSAIFFLGAGGWGCGHDMVGEAWLTYGTLTDGVNRVLKFSELLGFGNRAVSSWRTLFLQLFSNDLGGFFISER
jgi:hypothetical protein